MERRAGSHRGRKAEGRPDHCRCDGEARSTREGISVRAIDRQKNTYDRQSQQLREQLMVARMAQSDAECDALDIEGTLAFAERALRDLPRLWLESPMSLRPAFICTLFPDRLQFDGERFRTPSTINGINDLAEIASGESSVASPTGFGTASGERERADALPERPLAVGVERSKTLGCYRGFGTVGVERSETPRFPRDRWGGQFPHARKLASPTGYAALLRGAVGRAA